MKPLNSEDLYWFVRWVLIRRQYKNLMVENGTLKSEIEHLNHLLNQKSVALRLPEPKAKVRVKKYNNNNKKLK